MSDLRWQAQNDADTMARYQELINDKPRLNRAIKAANQRAKDLAKQAATMQSAAKTKISRKK